MYSCISHGNVTLISYTDIWNRNLAFRDFVTYQRGYVLVFSPKS